MRVEVEVDETRKLNERIGKFWDLDTVGVREQEKSVYDKFIEDVVFKEGRYEVRLPFREGHPLIADNYRFSLNHLRKLTRKLRETPDILKEYDDIIQNQLEMGIVEKVGNHVEIGEGTYSPHRAVIRTDKETTKVRIVLNHSFKTMGPSLNDCMHTGPCLIPLLYDVLLRFRVPNIVMVADIK